MIRISRLGDTKRGGIVITFRLVGAPCDWRYLSFFFLRDINQGNPGAQKYNAFLFRRFGGNLVADKAPLLYDYL